MMQNETFIIRYITVKNCFVYLPEIWARKLDRKANGIKISHNNKDYYLSWRSTSGTNESLGINATFARALGVNEGDEVIVSCVSVPPYLSAITVTPWSAHDWEIVQYQADKIQSILLNLVSLVAKNQPIVVWISKGLWITLLIDEIHPDFLYGSIGNDTEVHVTQEYNRINRRRHIKTDKRLKSKVWDLMSNISFLMPDKMYESKTNGVNNVSNDIRLWMKNNVNSMIPQQFRVHSLSAIKANTITYDSCIESPHDVFIHESDIPRNCPIANSYKMSLYKIRKVREDRQYVNTSTDFLRTDQSSILKQSTELIVRLLIIENNVQCDTHKIEARDMKTLQKKIYIPTNLRRILKLHVGSKVLLEPVKDCYESITSIEIFPSAESVTSQVVEKFLFNAMAGKDILLNTRSRIYLKDGNSFMVLLSPKQCSYGILNSVKLKNVAVNVKNVLRPEIESWDKIDNDFQTVDVNPVSLLFLDSILSECRSVLELSLGLTNVLGQNSRCDPGNVLICGGVGVGKSTLCKILQIDMHKEPHSIHTHVIECKSLKGKKVEAFQKIISAAMAECIYYQPSILFLDDLDIITNSPSDEEAQTPDSINSARIVDVLFNTAAEYQSSHYVSIVATCTDMNKIGSKLKLPRGVHLFRTILTIPVLEKKNRIDILKLGLQRHIRFVEVIDWDYYGNKTDGWVAQDLVDFSEKAAFAAWKRHAQYQTQEAILEDKDLRETLEKYKAISLHGVELYGNAGYDWSHIGGLANVKEMLTQLLEWPLKYSELYRNAPIKNQNGVLLYGMPGTGKTILAGAIAKQCGLNLISVKGPELLSKYIGASEEAVRNVFEKARRAKPCVLFFDEFDSLAPRRGHDSTGVTDRVVNQLLTQLDGVEGREGVAIVAASSRPDLLDPALIRPGRLDKSLLCPLPDENDREEILIALCKTQGINTKYLDLKSVAKLSSGFSGADLNAILTQAKYAALEYHLGNSSMVQHSPVSVEVTQEYILDSLKSTNPSVTSAENAKYQRIYAQFAKGNIEMEAVTKQKATLA